MKSTKVLSGCLVGISVLVLSCSNGLAQNGGWQPAVAELRAEIADIKDQIAGLPDLEKRVAELEKLVAENQNAIAKNTGDIANNKANISVLQDEIDALKKLIADLANAPTPQLACVTGMFAPGSMDDPIITSQMNISISDPYEVFTIYDESKTGGDSWGLLCNDGWINTGCSSAVDGTSDDLDVSQMNNGCYSDDEEYDKLWLYTNCCKMVGDQQ